MKQGFGPASSDIHLKDLLGTGNFGVVRKATIDWAEASVDTEVAVKIIHLDDIMSKMSSSRSPEEQVWREIEVMRQLDHPNIITLLGARCSNPPDPVVSIVLELCKGPDLQEILDARGALNEEEAQCIASQITDALCYLHSIRIIHRDVKPANCMLTNPPPSSLRKGDLSGCHVKLLDFGFAKHLSSRFLRKKLRKNSSSSRLKSLLSPSRRSRDPEKEYSRSGGSLPGLKKVSSRNKFFNIPINVSSNALDEFDPPPFPSSSTPEGLDGSRNGLDGSGFTLGLDGSKNGLDGSGLTPMTPIGTRFYADPILSNVGLGEQGPIMTDKEALLLDAFSLGKVIRYLLTGVPPNQTVQEALSGATCCSSQRIVELSELNPDARQVIKDLSIKNPGERLTILECQIKNPWLMISTDS